MTSPPNTTMIRSVPLIFGSMVRFGGLNHPILGRLCFFTSPEKKKNIVTLITWTEVPGPDGVTGTSPDLLSDLEGILWRTLTPKHLLGTTRGRVGFISVISLVTQFKGWRERIKKLEGKNYSWPTLNTHVTIDVECGMLNS